MGDWSCSNYFENKKRWCIGSLAPAYNTNDLKLWSKPSLKQYLFHSETLPFFSYLIFKHSQIPIDIKHHWVQEILLNQMNSVLIINLIKMNFMRMNKNKNDMWNVKYQKKYCFKISDMFLHFWKGLIKK